MNRVITGADVIIRKEIAQRVAMNHGMHWKQVDFVIAAALQAIRAFNVDGKIVRLRHFGSFLPITRKARKVHMVRTRTVEEISACNTIKFHPGAEFLNELNARTHA